jgi:hypothetical protein
MYISYAFTYFKSLRNFSFNYRISIDISFYIIFSQIILSKTYRYAYKTSIEKRDVFMNTFEFIIE